MNYEKFTNIAQEALQEATELAIRYDSPQVSSFHLLQSLLGQDKSVVRQLIKAVSDEAQTKPKSYSTLLDDVRAYNENQPKIQ